MVDVPLWDSGNNDTPFVVPDVEVVLLDPYQPVDLSRISIIKQPICRVTYRLEEEGASGFKGAIQSIILNAKRDESFSQRLPLT